MSFNILLELTCVVSNDLNKATAIDMILLAWTGPLDSLDLPIMYVRQTFAHFTAVIAFS